jgi:hypothetical protein
MCAWRFKITVARRQLSNLWRRSGTDGSGIFLTFLSLRPHREQTKGRHKWRPTQSHNGVFFAPAPFASAERSTVGLLSLQHT